MIRDSSLATHGWAIPLLRSHVAGQAFRFLVIGGLSYFINLGLYSLGLLVGLDYLAAAAIAFCLGFAFNFRTNRSWTFAAGSGNMTGQFVRFSCVAAIILGLDLLLLRAAVGELQIPSVPAQAGAILLLAPLSFLGNRLWAFRTPPQPERA